MKAKSTLFGDVIKRKGLKNQRPLIKSHRKLINILQ